MYKQIFKLLTLYKKWEISIHKYTTNKNSINRRNEKLVVIIVVVIVLEEKKKTIIV